MADFPKKQQQCLIPKYLLDYTTELNKNHPDPTDPWGGGGGSPIEAGTGIEITGDETKTISIDETVVATKNDLSDYELKADAFSGDYNDLTNKPTIPDPVSGTNDGTNWTSLTIGSDTYGLASGGSTYTAGTGIDITNDTISVDNDVAMKTDLPTSTSYPFLGVWQSDVDWETIFPHLIFNKHIWDNIEHPSQQGYWGSQLELSGSDLYKINLFKLNPFFGSGFSTNYDSVNSEYHINLDTSVVALQSDIPTDVSDLNNDAGYITGITSSDVTTALGYTPYNSSNPAGYITGINSSDVITALGYTPGTSNFSGSYNDLTDKPTIPDTTYMVTTNTAQNITANKTFTNGSKISLDSSVGGTEVTNGNVSNVYAFGGVYNKTILDSEGIRYTTDPTETSVTNINFETPTSLNSITVPDKSGTLAVTSDIITSYNDLTNKPSIPSTATSTVTASTDTVVSGVTGSTTTVVSGVTYTPATETLVFTYTDNTTATITLLTSNTTVTSATTTVLDSVSSSTATVMTGATVTTTLS